MRQFGPLVVRSVSTACGCLRWRSDLDRPILCLFSSHLEGLMSMTSHPGPLSASIDPVKLDRLAEVAVKVGLQLRRARIWCMTAPVGALPLVRRIAEHAYKAGAGLVTPIFADEEITLARYRHGPDASFDRAPGWLYEGMAKAFDGNAARLAIVGENPMLLSGEDPAKVARANKANSIAYKPALEKITGFAINWNIIAYPNACLGEAGVSGRQRGYRGGEAGGRHLRRLARRCRRSRLGVARPQCGADQAHRMAERRALSCAALFRAGHRPHRRTGRRPRMDGGASTAKNGITCNPNIPTEEVFTTPHARRVEGFVASTKPLSYQGTLIEDIQVRFEEGRIVEAKASRGEEVLKKVLDTDEGARRLGEVALVPHSSPISKSGLLFYNTLFDENAACHIALGQCYSKCFVGGGTLVARADRRARRQQEPYPHRLDDRLGPDRHRRRHVSTGRRCRSCARANGLSQPARDWPRGPWQSDSGLE